MGVVTIDGVIIQLDKESSSSEAPVIRAIRADYLGTQYLVLLTQSFMLLLFMWHSGIFEIIFKEPILVFSDQGPLPAWPKPEGCMTWKLWQVGKGSRSKTTKTVTEGGGS